VSVSAQETVFHHVGNGVTVTFAYGCQVLQASDLLVYLNDELITSGFIVNGIGIPTGGTVTFDGAPSPLAQVRLERLVTLERLTDYQQNGDFLARVVNSDLNRLWMALQQHLTILSRALLAPKSDATGPAPLPAAAKRASKLLGFDAQGNPVAVVPVAGSAAGVIAALGEADGVGLIGNAVDKRSLGAAAGASLVHTKGPLDSEVERTAESIFRDVVHVNRFGGNLKTALQKVPPYTTIVLEAKTYDISGLYSNDFNFGAGPFIGNTKRGIRLQGAGMPRLNATGTALEGGTVLQGTLFNLAHDFECYDLGVDCGLDVLNSKYNGAFAEVFVPGANTTYPAPQATIKNIKCDRIIALGAAPTNGNAATYKHVMLFENLENVKIGSIEAIGGWHAFVSKSIDLQCASLTVRGGMGDSMNFNANVANYCRQNQFGNILVDSWFQNNVEQKPGTIIFFSDQTVSPFLTKFKIGNLVVRNFKPGTDVLTVGGDSFVTDVSIGHLDVDMGTSGAAVLRMGYGPTKVQRFTIGSHNIITSGRSFELGANVVGLDIGHGLQTYIGDAAMALMTFDASQYTHGNILMSITVAQTGAYMIQRNAGDLDISRIAFAGAAAPAARKLLSSSAGGFVLSGNAAQMGNPAFAAASAYYRPYRVQFAGVLKMTTAGANISLGAVSPGPLVNMRFPCHVQTAGGAMVTRTLEITNAGSVAILDAMALNDLVFLDSISFDALTR